MKKRTTSLLLLMVVLSGTLLLPSCIKDQCKESHRYTIYLPVYKTTDEVRANIKSNPPKDIQSPGKIYISGNYIFLNEIDRGIHIIDNSNPANPRNVAFIDIPGNLDMAVKGNTLYADLYTDLVTIDITNPLSIAVKKITENMFAPRYYSDILASNNNGKVVADWVKRDTTVTQNCGNYFWWRGGGIALDAMTPGASTAYGGGDIKATPIPAMGGSMARFTIVNNYLYTVSNADLSVVNISSPNNPQYLTKKNIGWNIETLYPFRNNLFIGSSTGMMIYSISNPTDPVQTGQFAHVRTCDPVIADNDYAYVTLRSGTICQGFTNELDILSLASFTNPVLLKTYNLTNPHGLSKDGNTLFVCDGASGLKVFNASDVNNLQVIKNITGLETYDVIAYNKWALVVAKDGLYQFDYSDLSNIKQLSKISVKQ